MRCVNFDREFERYLAAWMKANSQEYKDYDAMEAAVPQVYAAFLAAPAPWLDGEKPGEYFARYDDAEALVQWMLEYFAQRVPVPDMLMNRIAELGLAAEGPLMRALNAENAGEDVKMTAVNLLREIESEAPLAQYVAWQAKRGDEKDELCDNALDSLASLGEKAAPLMRAALPGATPDGQEALLALLCDYPGDENVFQTAMKLFAQRRDKTALLADCLGKLGDERALPALIARAKSEETPYLDYIELRNAIERLGGEAPDRLFDAADPLYDALRDKQ